MDHGILLISLPVAASQISIPFPSFLRKATKKTANRTLEDSGVKQDLSELIESLLQQWISARP